MNTSLIIPNFSAVQIPSDNNILQASIILMQYSRGAFHYTVTHHNPSTSLALTEHQTEDSGTDKKRRIRQPERKTWGGYSVFVNNLSVRVVNSSLFNQRHITGTFSTSAVPSLLLPPFIRFSFPLLVCFPLWLRGYSRALIIITMINREGR